MILQSSTKTLSVFFFFLFILISTVTHADEIGTSEDTTSEDFADERETSEDTTLEDFNGPICTVTRGDGSDATEDLLVSEFSNAYVNCTGTRVCEGAKIEGCSDVRCSGEEACLRAQITNATESVLCEGVHACHYTDILMASTSKSVTCLGGESCDNAEVTGYRGEGDLLPSLELDCDGTKACRNVTAEWIGLVKCHGGTATEPACKDLATFDQIGCMYCGEGGCASASNMCRYKLVQPNVVEENEDSTSENNDDGDDNGDGEEEEEGNEEGETGGEEESGGEGENGNEEGTGGEEESGGEGENGNEEETVGEEEGNGDEGENGDAEETEGGEGESGTETGGDEGENGDAEETEGGEGENGTETGGDEGENGDEEGGEEEESRRLQSSDYQVCQPVSIVGGNNDAHCPDLTGLQQELNTEILTVSSEVANEDVNNIGAMITRSTTNALPASF